MNPRRALVYSGVLAALLFFAPVAMAANRSYELGLEASSHYRYSEALVHFQAAAEQGDRNAQRNLGLMLLYGEQLYGPDVRRDHEQAKRWLQTAAANGCEMSDFMLKAIATKQNLRRNR